MRIGELPCAVSGCGRPSGAVLVWEGSSPWPACRECALRAHPSVLRADPTPEEVELASLRWVLES